ncbi:MAG: TRAP transporter substrate-binding protein [Pseudomonadota bacterium]
MLPDTPPVPGHPRGFRLLQAAFLGLFALGAGAAPAKGQTSPPVTQIEIASTFPPSLPMLGEGMRRLIDRVRVASGGTLAMRLHEPGVLVPGAETVNAVARGQVDAAWAGAGWFAGGDSAFNLFSTVPFGPAAGEYIAWLYHGGGLELAREMFHARGVHNIPCALLPPEASGWFRQEITDVAQLRGMRIRFFGLGARVMQRLGATTVQLPPGEIATALAAGTIDAAEFSVPSMDLPLGLHRHALYYYFPAWHQQATLFDLYIHLDRWRAMPEQHRAIIELACSDLMRDMLARGEAEQGSALRELREHGVELRRWSPEILVAFEDAWNAVVAEEAEASPNFTRVYRSYEAFRASYAIWRRLNHLQ